MCQLSFPLAGSAREAPPQSASRHRPSHFSDPVVQTYDKVHLLLASAQGARKTAAGDGEAVAALGGGVGGHAGGTSESVYGDGGLTASEGKAHLTGRRLATTMSWPPLFESLETCIEVSDETLWLRSRWAERVGGPAGAIVREIATFLSSSLGALRVPFLSRELRSLETVRASTRRANVSESSGNCQPAGPGRFDHSGARFSPLRKEPQRSSPRPPRSASSRYMLTAPAAARATASSPSPGSTSTPRANSQHNASRL